MKRLGMLVTVGALTLGVALPAMAQQQPFTVTFGGEMRVIGIAWDNVTDFNDDADDEQRRYFQRWRLFTRVESADKKAKAVWAVEVGDLTWGTGNSPSGTEYGGVGAGVGSAGRGAGAGLGADGVNVETKLLYIQFDLDPIGLPGTNLLAGAHNIVFLEGPNGALMDDDGFGIQFNWKADPIDLQLYTVKIDENNVNESDDNDFYAARLGINVAKDLRVTVEALVVDQNCFGTRAGGGGCATAGDADFGDTFWFGGTAATKVGDITLNFAAVYGQRRLLSVAGDGSTFEESGFGVWATARLPLGPASTWWHAWYTTGDEARPLPAASNGALTGDSDRLPIPIGAAGFFSVPFVAEWLFGIRTIGLPFVGSPLYADQHGTWGVGGSGIVALTPAFSVGGGAAYVAATEDNGPFGDSMFEIDAGALYTYNPQLSFQLIAGYQIPDEGDDAWAIGTRARFAF